MDTSLYARNKLLTLIKEEKLDAILITEPCDLRYFTGFTGGEGIAVAAGSTLHMYTDSRYTTQVAEQSPEWEFFEVTSDRPYAARIAEFFREAGVRTVGFEDAFMTVQTYEALTKAAPGISFAPESMNLLKCREVKTSEELEAMATAEEIGSAAYEYIITVMKPGMTEKEVAAELEHFMRKSGADGTSFETIVGSGSRSAMPHGTATDKKLAKGDLVVMDFGCMYQGYCSDMTRTVVMGEAADWQNEIRNVVLEAQETAIAALKPGMVCHDADKIARDIIVKAGYGDYFGHSLGHGVGLYIHEEPRLSKIDDTILAPGMAVTVEPGIYLPGKGGVRIEDLIAITEDGHRNLTTASKGFSLL